MTNYSKYQLRAVDDVVLKDTVVVVWIQDPGLFVVGLALSGLKREALAAGKTIMNVW